ncbi:MAG TPA: exosortase H-associated membrane protein, partial [Casimicrobiaceae bacterium]|nr:exosortase H-associated membrane protein [Casimicrobiaceae bacterium]
MRTPLGRFVLKVLAWLPAAFVVWYFGAPILLYPVKVLLALAASAGLPDIVTGIEQNAAVFTFATTLKPGAALGTTAR